MGADGNSSRLIIAAAAAASILAVAVVAVVTMAAMEDAANSGPAGLGSADALPATNLNATQTGDGAAHGINPENSGADIIMPTKVSRPGCEETSSCYVPSTYAATVGQPVTWINEDSAFHSVTSGTYDAPLDAFDSGYMEPYDSYVLSFDAPGTYHYYCTLHPWMQGVVIVTPGK